MPYKDREKHLAYFRKYNKTKRNWKKYYTEHYKARLTTQKKYNATHKDKIRRAAALARKRLRTVDPNYGKKHYRKYKKYYVRKATLRLAHIKRATPSWADIEAIKIFYDNCPIGYHVDHIIPLRSKVVSGLHVLANLQYLTIKENLKKHNKFVVDEL